MSELFFGDEEEEQDEGEAPKKHDHDLLLPLRGAPRMRSFCTIDIETVDWTKPYAVGFYDGSKYVDFIGPGCIGKALEHVLQPQYAGRWIYAHNGGNFDFTFFLRHLLKERMERRFKTVITPIGSCMFRVDISARGKEGDTKRSARGRMKWTFMDSARLLPLRLDELGETFGLGKKVKLGMTYNELAQEKNRTIMRKYLKQDCVLLHRSVAKVQELFTGLGGQIGPTLPSASLDLWRRHYQSKPIYTNRHFIQCEHYGTPPASVVSCGSCGHRFIRRAYFGGDTQIFRMQFLPSPGHEEAYLYDFNSMYPAMMRERMPVGRADFFDAKKHPQDEAFVWANATMRTGIVDCDVSIPEDCYLPPLPVRHHGKLIFPVGQFSGVWDTCELELLKEVGGTITKVRSSAWFEESPIFAAFVNRLYKYRDKSNPDWNKGLDWLAKIVLNSAYGKFAMREDRQRLLIHPDTVEGLIPIDMTSDIWSERVRVAPAYIAPALSVHITALSRVLLWRALWNVLKLGGRIYYCDTDSIICSGVKLPTGKKLGELKLEATITRAEFKLPKLYLLETTEANAKKKREKNIKVKAKGMGPGIKLPGDLTEDDLDGQLSESEFVDLIKKGVPVQRYRLSKFREGLNNAIRKTVDFPAILPSAKKLATEYDKRIILSDLDTRPLVFRTVV